MFVWLAGSGAVQRKGLRGEWLVPSTADEVARLPVSRVEKSRLCRRLRFRGGRVPLMPAGFQQGVRHSVRISNIPREVPICSRSR